MGVRSPPRGVDRLIADLAARQHGVVARWQLSGFSVGRSAIARRVRAGLLHRIHAGVYLVGHTAEPPLAREAAAVLACRGHAVISHRSAAAMWGLVERKPEAFVEVTTHLPWLPSRPSVRVHRTGGLDPRDLRRKQGIPLTSPARTLFDLARTTGADELERIAAEAQARRLCRRRDLDDQVERNRGRPGVPALRALLALDGGPSRTRSPAERRLLRLIRAADLPQPETDVELGGFVVDFLWREQWLVVEVDGFAFHSSRRQFERDRRRDAELQALGYRVLRVTWRQIEREPEAVLVRIRRLLAASGGSSRL